MSYTVIGTITVPDKDNKTPFNSETTLLDSFSMHFDKDKNKISIRSTWTDIEIGINADDIIDFINRNKPDIFEPF